MREMKSVRGELKCGYLWLIRRVICSGRDYLGTLLFVALMAAGWLQPTALAQATTNFRAPLVYGYQADPMMTYYNGNYWPVAE